MASARAKPAPGTVPTVHTWPADHVERWPIERLIPYARNARTHSDAQIAQIAASIREWGWTAAVLVDEAGTIIAGHGRVLAARQLALADVPVTVARGWSDAQKRAYTLADNKLAMNAGWDEEMLKLELGDLQLEGFDVGLIGFDGTEMDGLFGDAGDADGGLGGSSGAGSLAEKFGVPPFTVLNAREGWWQDRKRAWLALGIQSELGRGDVQPGLSGSPEDYRRPEGNYAKPAPDYSKRERGDGRGRPVH